MSWLRAVVRRDRTDHGRSRRVNSAGSSRRRRHTTVVCVAWWLSVVVCRVAFEWSQRCSGRTVARLPLSLSLFLCLSVCAYVWGLGAFTTTTRHHVSVHGFHPTQRTQQTNEHIDRCVMAVAFVAWVAQDGNHTQAHSRRQRRRRQDITYTHAANSRPSDSLQPRSAEDRTSLSLRLAWSVSKRISNKSHGRSVAAGPRNAHPACKPAWRPTDRPTAMDRLDRLLACFVLVHLLDSDTACFHQSLLAAA